ncbi:hypothetical protein [Aquipluma nitroreducens]|uniref:hypothetical protein n=1 Tax=Aquipluma nitroreducens TaxID=2010828 RepID=UPI00384DCB18
MEYTINFESTGEFTMSVLVSPSLNFNANKGLRYTISFDRMSENQQFVGSESRLSKH